MNSKKFAAHYMLSPEGHFLKWPVITLREDGQILDIQTSPDGLKEQPAVSFFSGILAPAFIDIWLMAPPASLDARFFNRHFSQGTLIMRKPNNWPPEESRRSFPLLCSCQPGPMDVGLSGENLPLWGRIISLITSGTDISFSRILHRITAGAAGISGISNAGKLVPGASPGLLLIRKADLTGPFLTHQTEIKWLNVPSTAHFESLTQETK